MKLLFIDTETTGVDFKNHSIHQINMVYENGSIEKEFNYFIRPYKEVNPSALLKGDVKLSNLLKYQEQNEVFQTFIDDLNSIVNPMDRSDKLFFIAYNSEFDEQMIRAWFLDNGNNFFGSYFWNPTICVMKLAAKALMFQRPMMENFKLETVCKQFNISALGKQHEARNDVEMMRKLYKFL